MRLERAQTIGSHRTRKTTHVCRNLDYITIKELALGTYFQLLPRIEHSTVFLTQRKYEDKSSRHHRSRAVSYLTEGTTVKTGLVDESVTS